MFDCLAAIRKGRRNQNTSPIRVRMKCKMAQDWLNCMLLLVHKCFLPYLSDLLTWFLLPRFLLEIIFMYQFGWHQSINILWNYRRSLYFNLSYLDLCLESWKSQQGPNFLICHCTDFMNGPQNFFFSLSKFLS